MKQMFRRYFSSAAAAINVSTPTASGFYSVRPVISRISHKPVLSDTYGRFHKYLRLSVTEKCSFRCRYCMPVEGVKLSPADTLLTTDEMLTLTRIFIQCGVNKIRLTGGEALVHKDIDRIVREIGQYTKGFEPKLETLAMTTNGLVLSRHLRDFRDYGMKNINISLDTLVEPKFELFARRKGFKQVWNAFQSAIDLGYKVKLNCVVMNGKNDDEINDFVELTKDKEFTMVFIELMPFDSNDWKISKMTTYKQMKQIIESKYGPLQRCLDGPNATAKTYQVPGHKGKIGFITSMTNNFCSGCDRIRLLSTGDLKICLFDNRTLDLRTLVRLGWREEDIMEAISYHIKKKHAKHAGKTVEELATSQNNDMVKIGG